MKGMGEYCGVEDEEPEAEEADDDLFSTLCACVPLPFDGFTS